MKAIWKGTLSFGLVNIYVEIYTATQEHRLGFKLLHEKCNTPVNYQRWCSTCKKTLGWEDIVKGIKLSDDTYFIITPENLKALRPEKTDSLEIIEFVDFNAIDPLYLDQHYYVVPIKQSDKAYFLFTTALAKLEKVAIGRIVFKDKEHICAIQPYQQGLMMTTLNYDYEIRSLAKLEELEPPASMASRELRLAEQFITKLSKKKFDMSRFKDSFAEKLKAKIKKMAKGVAIPTKVKKETALPEEPSLMDALKASLEKHAQHPGKRSSR